VVESLSGTSLAPLDRIGDREGWSVARDDESTENFESLREEPVRAVVERDGGVVVELAGELDLYNVESVRRALLDSAASKPDRLVVDLSAVEFIDSTALGAFVEARSHLGNGRFVLAGPGLEARRALEVSGLDRHFAVHASVDDALASTPD
jgi:anti-sigma B factor antagonist